MTIKIDPYYVYKNLLIFILVLLLCHLGVNIIKYNYVVNDGIWSANKWIKRIIVLFDLDTEHNIPTLYSSLSHLFSSLLLFCIARFNRISHSMVHPWVLLGIIFLFLSVDEMVALHEHFSGLTQNLFDLTGFGTAYWIIPYLTALILLFLYLIKFLKQLPQRTLFLFVLSGFIFISGAVVMEIIGHRYKEFYGNKNPVYTFLSTIEEILEMVGIATFIFSLLSFKSFSIKIK